jgi:trehalose 6-phosphate phosphatase
LPRRVEGWAFFLDFDGTLVDISDVPNTVVVPDDLRSLLSRLSDKAAGALALVSGRSIATLDNFLKPLRLPTVGVHGAEMRLADADYLTPVVPEAMEIARRALSEVAARHPALILEDKGVAVALHFRGVPELEAVATAAAEQAATETGGVLVVQHGKMIVELRPANTDKGRALAALMERRPFLGRRPIAIGDDVTDETMFAMARSLGGTAARVGQSGFESAASERFANPAAVRGWLAGLE